MNISTINNELLKLICENNENHIKVDLSNKSGIKLITKACEGTRHDTMVRMAGALSRQGLDVKTLQESLMSLNNVICDPPLPAGEINTIAKSIHQYKNYKRNPDLYPHQNNICGQIAKLLFANKGNASARYLQIAALIIKDLKEQGSFIRTTQGNYFYFHDDSKELISINRENINYRQLMRKYRLNPKMPAFEFITHEIIICCSQTAHITNVYKYSYYDITKNIIYIKCGHSQMLKVDINTVTRCDNGTDGVLFSDLIDVSDFEYIDNLDTKDYINDYLISLCNFNDIALEEETQKILAKAYFIALFMPEFLSTKPIITLVGTKGSAKTTLLKAFIKTLYGPKHTVVSMPSKAEDLDVLVANTHFLAIDNLDTHRDGLNDRLAVYATGGTIKRRKLYTDGEIYEADLSAFIGISSRALFVKRDDVLQRMILLELSSIKGGYMDEKDLIIPICAHRNEILTQAINEAQKVMRIIQSGKNQKIRSSFRMADFAKFLTCLLDDHETAENHLQKMTVHQREICIEYDVIIPHLASFTLVAEDKFYSANLIYKIIVKNSKTDTFRPDIKSDFEKSYESVNAFAKRLNNIKDDIREFIQIETRKGHGNFTVYRFTKGERFKEIESVYRRVKVERLESDLF